MEVRAADQIGLLHLISKTISRCGFSIQFARVATEQGIATDIFNIERAAEMKILLLTISGIARTTQ